jgi:hypothetical protein
LWQGEEGVGSWKSNRPHTLEKGLMRRQNPREKKNKNSEEKKKEKVVNK